MTAETDKIELSEQTPLKTDTDAPTTNEHQPEGTDESTFQEETDKSKKGFKLFHFGKGHKHGKHEGGKTDEKETVETNEKSKEDDEKKKESEPKKKQEKNKEKKSSWWNQKCQKVCNNDQHPDTAQINEQGQLTYGVNLVQRDDNALHTAVDFSFEDIYGEPDSVHSWAGIWKANHCVFLAVRNFFYKLFSAIIVLPSAIIFGILYALISVIGVYIVVPAGRLISIPANFIFKAWNYIISSIFDPVFHAIGQCFTNVRISQYGINTDPTTVLTA